uniref:Uncharacterized protein n=1 Tax=Panagrolaimus sp. ES5 TaxID=591445 RepID=A0AC34FQM9_9BILA
MPCLNQDLLFDIGKQLIEDGDSDAVIRFALSGKESFQAMSKVFASVTTLKLYYNQYSIGWDKQCSTFQLGNGKNFSKFIFFHIGNCIKNLHIDGAMVVFVEFYQPLFKKLLAKKRNPFLSSIKDLTFNVSRFYASVEGMNQIAKYFTSLESLNFIIRIGEYDNHFDSIGAEILNNISKIKKVINQSKKIPPKVTCSFYKFKKEMKFPDLKDCKFICSCFEPVESIPAFYCFQETLHSKSQKTVLEVQISM